jgi:hypothetical protein
MGRALSQECRSHRQHPILARLVTTITTTLDTLAAVVHRLWQGVTWLTDIRMLLDPTQTLALSRAGVAADLSAYLAQNKQTCHQGNVLSLVVFDTPTRPAWQQPYGLLGPSPEFTTLSPNGCA